MSLDAIEQLKQEIIAHKDNRQFTKQGYLPLFQAATEARILIIG